MQRINTHSRLCVRQIDCGLQAEPEVRELIGELALAGHIRIRELSATDNQCSRVHIQCAEQQRYIFRVMLSVGIDRQRIVKAEFQRFLKAGSQRLAFAFILNMRNHSDREVKGLQLRERIVRTTVIDHDDIAYLLVDAAHDIGYGLSVVISRNKRTNMLL